MRTLVILGMTSVIATSAQAQQSWFTAAQLGAAATLSSGDLPALAAGITGGLDVVSVSRFTVRAKLIGTAPISYNTQVVCDQSLGAGCSISDPGAAQVATLTGDVLIGLGAADSRLRVALSLGVYGANPTMHQPGGGHTIEPNTGRVMGVGVEYLFGANRSWLLSVGGQRFHEIYQGNPEALTISFSRQFRLK